MKTSARSESLDSDQQSPPHPPAVEARAPHVSTISRGAGATRDAALLAEQMVECAPVAMVALDVATLSIIIANEQARTLYAAVVGAGETKLVGTHLERYTPLLKQIGIWGTLRTVIETGQPRRGLQIEGIALPGREELSSWCYEIVPLQGADGAVTTLLITVVERTAERLERERAERAIYAAELRAERMESILDSTGDAMLICDTEGQTVAYNRAALAFATNRLVVEQGRAHGRRIEPIWELLQADHTPIAQEERPERQAMQTSIEIATVELGLRREDGVETPLIVQATPLRDEMDAVTGAVVTFHDITTMKEIERQKDEFIAVASHELRQPLTVIQGQAQMIQRHLRRMLPEPVDAKLQHGEEALRRISAGIESQTIRMNMLVSDLLDMSRIQTGQLRLDPVRLTLLPVVRHVVEIQLQSTQLHVFTLLERWPADMPEPQGLWDRRRIEQILVNLLGNAAKYSPDHTEIRVEVGLLNGGTSAGQAGGGVGMAHLIVRDSGIGIPADAMPKLFNRFFRASNAAGFQGTGLGLFISLQLAQAHGGDLWAESAGIGEGSAFHLTLPLSPTA